MKIKEKLNNDLLKVLIIDSVILIIAVIYSLIHYYTNSIKIEEGHFLYFLDKGLASVAVVSISLSYIIGNLNKLKNKKISKLLASIKYFGIVGFLAAAVHASISLAVMDNEKYPYLYQSDGIFNFYGEMTLLFGVLTIALLMMPAMTSIPEVRNAMNKQTWLRYQRIGYLGLISSLFHIYFVEFIHIEAFTKFTDYIVPLAFFLWFMVMLALSLKLLTLLKSLKKETKNANRN